MWMQRAAWCLCFDSERREGGKRRGWAKCQGTVSESELLWVLLRYLEYTKKVNAWGGLTFYTKPPLYTRRGAIIRLFAPVMGAITWEKGQENCSAPSPPTQDWLLTWLDHWSWYAWSHMIWSLWTEIPRHSFLTDLCFHQLRSLQKKTCMRQTLQCFFAKK